MVSSDLGKLEAMRHFTSGSAACCARLRVGMVTALAARPSPAPFRNFLRCMFALLFYGPRDRNVPTAAAYQKREGTTGTGADCYTGDSPLIHIQRHRM